MNKLLVVDDEPDYCQHLRLALEPDGYTVRTATSGQEAIELAALSPPDVAVIDYLLRCHIDGLELVGALQTLNERLRSVLMTRSGASDLRRRVQESTAIVYLEKPFSVAEIRRLVHSAVELARQDAEPPVSVACGIWDVSSDGVIEYANERGRYFMRQRGVADDRPPLKLILPDAASRLSEAERGWIECATPGGRDTWLIRSRRSSGGHWLCCVLTPETLYVARDPVVAHLLGASARVESAWPLDGRAMLIDPREPNRLAFGAYFRSHGFTMHTAPSLEEGAGILSRDTQTRYVVLHRAACGEITPAVQQMLQAREGATVIGVGVGGDEPEFLAAGAGHFLADPLDVRRVADVLLDRLGDCSECGLLLPLCRAALSDVWECAGCGARYRGVLDASATEETRQNARRIH